MLRGLCCHYFQPEYCATGCSWQLPTFTRLDDFIGCFFLYASKRMVSAFYCLKFTHCIAHVSFSEINALSLTFVFPYSLFFCNDKFFCDCFREERRAGPWNSIHRFYRQSIWPFYLFFLWGISASFSHESGLRYCRNNLSQFIYYNWGDYIIGMTLYNTSYTKTMTSS